MAEVALFERVGAGAFRPGLVARGPWDAAALHGGPPAALVAGVLQRALDDAEPGAAPLQPARLTVDIERPVPLDVLRVSARVVRPGRKVRVAEAEITDGAGRRLLRASLLAIRRLPRPLDLAGAAQPLVSPPPPPAAGHAGGVDTYRAFDGPAFHSDGVDHRFVAGSFTEPGPSTDWIRLRGPVVAGEPVTPLERVAAAADFGNGVASALPMADWLFINPDLTIALHRLPEGEWVALDGGTHLDSAGVGTAECTLWDERGRLGRSVQTLLVDARRPPRPFS